jgi:hypothetical protein
MDIRALILVDAVEAGHQASLGKTPLALVDVTGASPLVRTIERLRQFGVSPVTVVVEDSSRRDHRPLPQGTICLPAVPGRLWGAAESAFNELAQQAELMLLVRLGAYAEIDFEKLVHFHVLGQRRVSQVSCGTERLEIFCLNASRRNDAASLLRSRLNRCRSECELFEHSGYVNTLSGPEDLRQFSIDVLTMKTQTSPAGLQIRPGIWAAPMACIDKGSRVLAPAFIGLAARIGCGAVITRCTSIERHAQVDCGTVVENSTVLPYVYVGAGLDLAHSVVSASHIANLRRRVTVDVSDEKLLGQVSFTAGRKLLSLARGLPARIRGRLFGEAATPGTYVKGDQSRPKLVPRASARGSQPADDEFASNLAVARKHGNQ